MVEKVAYYFLMMDIDYEFVLTETDDETMTQFILISHSQNARMSTDGDWFCNTTPILSLINQNHEP